MPWDNIPIGHMLHQILIRRIAAPASAEINSPFATVAFLLAKNFPKGHVGQTNLDFFSFFSMFRLKRSSRFIFILGMNRSTPLSKPSIIVPKGQIQPQNTDPNKNVKKKNNKIAAERERISHSILSPLWGKIPLVNRICKPPTGQINHPPGPT